MYHSQVIQLRLNRMADALRKTVSPKFEFRDIPIPEVNFWTDKLARIWDPEEQKQLRAFTPEEDAFVQHEIARSKCDYPYWVQRYAWIKTKAQEKVRVSFFESQKLILEKIANAEKAALAGKTGDGILLNILKARQLGASTLSETIISHRVFFYANTAALVAAHVDEQSAYLFDMMERVYDSLPWWMAPQRKYLVKDKSMYFGELDNLILVNSAKNMQGNSSDGLKGSMGTGKTFPLVHLSELALWSEFAHQIDDALMPSIPEHPRTLALFESTAKGRSNWWFDAWHAGKRGIGRRQNVFIGWYMESHTYTKPAPLDWNPSDLAIAHAKKVLDTSTQWCGKSIHLTKDQLYWWEFTRADYVERRKLSVFLAEYAADDIECFQNTTASVIPAEILNEMYVKARPFTALVDVVPRTPGGLDRLRRGAQ